MKNSSLILQFKTLLEGNCKRTMEILTIIVICFTLNFRYTNTASIHPYFRGQNLMKEDERSGGDETGNLCNEPWLQAADIEPCLEIKQGRKPFGMCEGDMIDSSEDCRDKSNDGETFHPRVRRVAKHYLSWPRNDDGFTYIPYHFTTQVESVKEAFLEAKAEFHASTCIRFIPKTNAHKNYIDVIHHEPGCYSYIGMNGGAQEFNLQYGTGCVKKGPAIHELMHALGFLHTMSRRDRDEYITVHYDNILRDEFEQFLKHHPGNGSVFGEIYDTQSIMHYGNYAFSRYFNRRKALTSKANPDEVLGQTNTFSKHDLLQVNKMYHCYNYLNLTDVRF